MVMSLGTISASINLDISGLSGSASKVASIFNGMSSLGKDAFSGFDSAVDSVGKRIDSLRGTKIDIDTGGATGSLQGVATAADDVTSSIKAASGTSFDVETGAAVASLSQVDSAAQSATSAVQAASGTSFSIETGSAIGDLAQVSAAAQDVGSAVTAASGVVFGLQASEALSGLQQVASAAQDAASAIQAAGGSSFDINTSDALGQLSAIGTAAQSLSAELQSVSGQTIAISVTRDQIDAALNAVTELRAATGQGMTAAISISGIGELESATTAATQTREAIGDISSAAPSIDFSGTVSQLNDATTAAEQLKGILSGLGSIGLGAGFAGLLLGPIIEGIRGATQLEQSFKNVEVALGNVTKTDLGRLESSIKNIGSATQYSAKEIANVAEELAKAGYTVTDMIDGKMLPAVANLASATGTDLNTAVTAVVQAMATWSPSLVDASIAMTDAGRAADILTVAANSSSADIQDIIAGMRNLGPVAAGLGISFDTAAAAISVFTNFGIKGADAGVSLARGLSNLSTPTAEAAIKMKELGISIFDAQGKFVGLESVFGQMSNALRGMSQEQQFTTIGLLLGAEAQDVYSIAVQQGVDPLNAIVAAMQQQGVASEQAAARTQTLSGAMQRLQEATSTALAGMAGGFVGPLTFIASTIDVLVSTFGNLPSAILQPIGAMAGFVGGAIALVSTINLARTAIGLMGTSIGQLTGISKAISLLKGLQVAFAETALGARALAIATGPIGIALLAIGVVAGVIGTIWLKNKQSAQEAAKAFAEMTAAIQKNDDAIGGKRAAGMTKLADDMEKATTMIRKAVADVSKSLEESQKDFTNLIANGSAQDLGKFFDTVWGKAALEWGKSSKLISDTTYDVLSKGTVEGINQASPVIQGEASMLMTEFYKSFKPSPGDITALEGSLDPVYKLLENPNIDPDKVWTGLGDIISKNIVDGKVDIQGATASINEWVTSMNTAAGAATLMKDNLSSLTSGQIDFTASIDRLRLNGNDSMANDLEAVSSSIVDLSGKYAEFGDAQKRIMDAVGTGNIDVPRLNGELTNLKMLYDTGAISADQYGKVLLGISLDTNFYAKATDDAWTSQEKLNKQMQDNVKYAKESATAYDEINRARTGEHATRYLAENLFPTGRESIVKQLTDAIAAGDTTAITSLTADLAKLNDQAETTGAAMTKLNDALHAKDMTAFDPAGQADFVNQLEAQTKAAEEFKTNMEAMGGVYQRVRDAQNAAYSDMIAKTLEYQGIESNLGTQIMAGHGTAAMQVAAGMQQTTSALETSKRVIIDNTDAIASNAQGLSDWSTKLIGARGEYAAVDDMLSNGMITLEEYNAAQKAQVNIMMNASGIAFDMQVIQAKQAPILAGLIDQQHVYVDQLRELPAAQQLVALGWMDAGEAAKASGIQATVAAAANGDLGASGKAMTQSMIEGAVAADPIIGKMLEDMGLISIGADGTITVNFDSAQGAMSDIDKLTQSVDRLIEVLGGVPPLHLDTSQIRAAMPALQAAFGDAVGPQSPIQLGAAALKKTLAEIGTTSVSPKVGVQGTDAASSAVKQIHDTMLNLNGETASPKVTVEGGPEAEGQTSNVSDALLNLAGVHATPKVEVQGGPEAESQTTNVSDALGQFDGINASAGVSVNDQASRPLRDIHQQINDIPPTKTVTINIVAVGAGAVDSAISAAGKAAGAVRNQSPQAGAIDNKTVTTTINAIDNASAVINGVKSLLTSIPGSTSVTINANTAAAIGLIQAVSNAMTGLTVSKTITITANAATALSNISSITEKVTALADKSITLTVNTTLVDTTGLLAGFSTAGGGAAALEEKSITLAINTTLNDTTGLLAGFSTASGGGAALEEKSITITVNTTLNDPTGLLGGVSTAGGAAASLSRTMTVTVTANDPRGLLDSAVSGLPGLNAPSSNMTRTMSITVISNDPRGLLDSAIAAPMTRTMNINVIANDPRGLLDTPLAGLPGLGDAGGQTRTITFNAVDNTSATAATVAAAITAIPLSASVMLSEFGSGTVIAGANGATSAIQVIPTSWTTMFSEFGAATVTAGADGATTAISGIPTSWSTSFSESGSGNVIGAANGITNAVNSVPSGKTISFNIVTTGSIPRFAKGGMIPAETTVARLAERGPELFRTPSGSYGMAMDDALYPMTPGARVYTAAQTKRMLRTWDGPAYADGGYVSRPTPPRVSASSSVSLSGGLLATVNGIVSGVQSTLQSGMQAATSTIQTSTTAWPTIVGAQQNPMADAGTMVGTSMSEGAAAGIAGAGWSVSNAAVSVVDAAIAAANAAAGIASPSTEMIPVGEYMDAGLAQGISNGQSAVVDAAVSVAQAAIDAYASTMKNGWTNVGDGSWQSGSTGVVQKGILAEDGSYVNPDFYKNNPPEFELWKKLFLSGQTSTQWPQYKARGYASGGTVRSDTARMGELGPELLRYPSGKTGMATTDGLYTVPLGTYVFTAAQTKRMMRSWDGPAYANGGRVARPATPIQRNGGSGSTVTNTSGPVTVHAQIHTTGKMDDGEKRDLVQDIATSFRDGIQLAHMGRGV